MRYKMTAKVNGSMMLEGPSPLSCERDGLTWELHVGPDGSVVAASVTCSVPADKVANFAGVVRPAAPGERVSAHVTIGGDRELFATLVSALQELESALGHTAHGPLVRHIRWDEAQNEFIAENDEERALLGVHAFSISNREQKRMVRIGAPAFQRLVQGATVYRPLHYTISLWREGMARLDDGQHLDALHYFFLAIEDLFADGHTGKKQTLSAFRSNPLCIRVFAAAVEAFSANAETHQLLRRMFQERQYGWSPDGAIEFLYSMRGQLSHASSRRRGFRSAILNQSEFRPVAVFAMHVVNLALHLKKVELLRADRGLPPEHV